jgi:hypothetical protein
MNDSDTEISGIVVNSMSSEYANLDGFDSNAGSFPTVPAATPPPVNLNVSLPAHQSQVLSFDACSTTPSPADTRFQFQDQISSIGYEWVTGYRGTTCIGTCP